MKHLALLLSCLVAGTSWALPPQQWGRQATVEFTMVDTDGTPLTGEVDGGAEVTLSCEETASSGTATSDFNETAGGGYDIVITAAELECPRLRMTVAASITHTYMIETYGSHLAQHPTVVYGERATAGTATTITLPSDASTDNDAYPFHMVHIIDGTCAGESALVTLYNGASRQATVNDAWNTCAAPDTTSLATIDWGEIAFVAVGPNGEIDSNVVAYSGDTVAGDNAEDFFDNTGFDASNSAIGTAGTLTGHTPQTGDSFTRIGAAGANLTAVQIADGTLDSATFAAGAITSSVFAAGAITATTFATDAITANVISADFVGAIWDHLIDGTLDAEEMLCYINAAIANVSNFDDVDTVVFRNAANNADMLTVVTSSGDRTSVVRSACGS